MEAPPAVTRTPHASLPAATFSPVHLVSLVALAQVPPMGDDEPKRRVLLPPGTYRINAHVALEADLTQEQLRALFQLIREVGAPVTVNLPAASSEEVLMEPRRAESELGPLSRPEPTPDEDARKARRRAQLQELMLEYERLLGPPPRELGDAIASWLSEFDLVLIRDVFEDVAQMQFGSPGTKYAHVKQELRRVRLDRDRGVPPAPRGGER
jgi:hypothetical protein